MHAPDLTVNWETIAQHTASQNHQGNATQLATIRISKQPRIEHEPHRKRSADRLPDIVRTTFNDLCNGRKRWPLFLYGEPGVGKTCAALCLLDHTSGPHKSSYFTVRKLCETLIDARNGRLFSETGYEVYVPTVWSRIQQAPAAVLDELAMRNVSDHHYEAVAEWIDRRHGRPSIAVSNMSLDEITTVYDGRIADRLNAGTVLHLTGESRRGSWRNDPTEPADHNPPPTDMHPAEAYRRACGNPKPIDADDHALAKQILDDYIAGRIGTLFAKKPITSRNTAEARHEQL